MKKWVPIFIMMWWILILTLLLTAIYTHAEERNGGFNEVNINYGLGMSSYKYTEGKLSISKGKYVNDWFSIRAEGFIGELMFKKDGYTGLQTGINIMLRHDPKIYKDWRFYIEGGVGVGYAQSPNNNLLGHGIACFMEGGMGIIIPIDRRFLHNKDFLIGYKYSHVSSSRPADKGINCSGIGLGIRW